MNLQLVRPGETTPSAEETSARAIAALAVSAEGPQPARTAGVSVFTCFDAASPVGGGQCLNAASEPATQDGRALACPNNLAEESLQAERALAFARLPVDGVLMETPDAWYAAGPAGAGYCEACEARLTERLRDAYGEQLMPSPPPKGIASGTQAAPFWREREAERLRSSVEHTSRLVRQLRDDVRRERSVELQVGGQLLGLSPAAVQLARRLDFAVIPAVAPSPDRAGLGMYEIFRAALTHRPLTVQAAGELAERPELVRQAARLASAVGAELSLPGSAPAASHTALTHHRQFWREFRSKYRPAERLAEVVLLYSAESDHWSRGVHGAGVLALAEVLTRLGTQYRIVLNTPRTGTEPLILVDAAYLSDEDSNRIERRITEGAGAIVIGPCTASDETGRPLSGPFNDLSTGLNRVGAGSAIALDLTPPSGERRWDILTSPLEKALESLLSRGRRAVTVSRPSIVVKMYLDPDRKLDVHLVGRQFDPVTGAPEEIKGLTVYLAGSAVSGARMGLLVSPDAPERKVPLAAYGMGVQATLPDFSGVGILSVTR